MPYKLSKEAEDSIKAKGQWMDPTVSYHAADVVMRGKPLKTNVIPTITEESVRQACEWIQEDGVAGLYCVLTSERAPDYPPMNVDCDPETQDRIDDVVHAAHVALRDRSKKVLAQELAVAGGTTEAVALQQEGDLGRVLEAHVVRAIQQMKDDNFAGLRAFCEEIFAPVREKTGDEELKAS